jgi:rhamnosyltransferase subunit B
MARVLLACWGSYGDLFPYLAIADALRALGHTPVVASCPYYADLVGREGLSFRPVRPDVQPDDPALLARLMDPRRGTEVVVREILVPAVRDSFADLAAAAGGCDLVVSHPVTFATPLVAEHRRLPWLASVLAPMSFFSADDYPALPNLPQAVVLRRLGPWTGRALTALARRATSSWMQPVRDLRAELGLPDAGHPLFEGQFSARGNLALFSSALGAPQADWPAHTTVTGFPFFNRAIAMPDAVSRFLDAGDPPVVFTLGSSAVNAPGRFYETSVAAAEAVGLRALLLVGRQPGHVPDRLPAGVLAVDSAPHDQVFPRAAVVVHQGGVGTTGQAMRSGRPQLVVPHAHDQFDNAFRVEQRGVARVIYAHRYGTANATTALRALAADQRYVDAAAGMARHIATEGGATAAASAIVAALETARR